MSAALLLAAWAHAATFKSAITEEIPPVEVGGWAGQVDQNPIPQWSRALPGRPMTSAAHAERTRPVFTPAGILVGSAAGSELYLLDRRDGGVIRSFAANTSVEAEPVVDGEDVIFTDTGGGVWCYSLKGELRWKFDTRTPAVTRPTVAQGKVIITTVDDLVVTLDRATGALAWRFQPEPDLLRKNELALYAAPPATVVGDNVLAGFSDGTLISLELATGDVSWGIHIGEGRYPDIVADPTLGDSGTIFASGYFEPLIAYRQTTGVVWSLDIGAAARALWIPAEGGGTLIHPGTDGKLRALDGTTGDERWSWSSGTDGSLTAPQLTPAGVLVGSTSGTLWLVDAATGEERWHYEPMRVMEGVSTAPAIDGRQVVFVTNAGRIYSLLAPAAEAPRPTVEWRWRRPDLDGALVQPLPGPGRKKAVAED